MHEQTAVTDVHGVKLREESVPETHSVIQLRSIYYFCNPIYISLGFWNVDEMVIISDLYKKKYVSGL
jgi:hypothetical protein